MSLLKKLIIKTRFELKILKEMLGISKTYRDNIPKHLIKKYISKEPIIIDCGAHVGSDSIELVRIFPNATVFAFEALPKVFQILQYNTRNYKNIQCYNLALGENNNIVDFYVSSKTTSGASSVLEPTEKLKKNHKGLTFEEKIKVQSITLDNWCKINSIPQIDLLWLDMQGYEYKMLKASEEILKHAKAIHTEVSITETYKEAVNYKFLKDWLGNFGFVPIVEAIPDRSDMGNVLFVKKL